MNQTTKNPSMRFILAAEGVFGAQDKQDVLSACYLPRAGMALATGMRSGCILLWCTKTGQARVSLTSHGQGTPAPSVHNGKLLLPGVGALALTKQHDQLVTAGGDGCVPSHPINFGRVCEKYVNSLQQGVHRIL